MMGASVVRKIFLEFMRARGAEFAQDEHIARTFQFLQPCPPQLSTHMTRSGKCPVSNETFQAF